MISNRKRINKYLSEMGVCSKRQADRWIEAGQIRVNNEPAFLGQLVSSADQVEVNGQRVAEKPQPVYLLYHKPVGVVCTNDQSVSGNLVEALNYPQRVFAIGRLDKASEGLLLLSNDGEIFNRILRAENAHEKEYLVTVDQPVNSEFIQQMSAGVEIMHTVTQPCYVEQRSKNEFKIILKQGLNRQIRRMCKALGYRVLRLQRTRIMNLQLAGLEVGSYRELTADERRELLALLEDSSSEISAEQG